MGADTSGMAAEPKRSISPWWSLLLLPVALGAGWLIAELPSPPPKPVAAPASVDLEPPASAPVPAASGKREWWQPGGGNEVTNRVGKPEGEAELQWMSFSSAVEESKRTGKPVLLDFNADWCPPCQMLKRTVFENGSLSRKIGGAVIGVSVVDRYREEGRNPQEIEELQRRYQIDAFPTLIVMSPATGRWEQVRGFGGPEATVDWILRTAASVQ